MTTYAEMTEKATAQLLEAGKPFEELAKSFATSTIDQVSKLPSLPAVEGVPSPLEVVSAHFALAEKLLNAQKDFAVRLAASVTPEPVKGKSTTKR